MLSGTQEPALLTRALRVPRSCGLILRAGPWPARAAPRLSLEPLPSARPRLPGKTGDKQCHSSEGQRHSEEAGPLQKGAGVQGAGHREGTLVFPDDEVIVSSDRTVVGKPVPDSEGSTEWE